MSNGPIAKPGHNCWRREHAERFARIVDAQDAYAAIARALSAARQQVLILGWDLHSQVELLRGERGEALLPGWPTQLAPLLEQAVERQPALQVHVLLWDFAMIYALERETFPVFKLAWKTSERIRFQLDDQHPIGASHHQKIVVVDDAIAFCGGLDLCQSRWDTRAHRTLEPRRMDPWGKPYPPFHDVHCAVDGAAAAALGDLARERWRRATGRELAAPRAEDAGDPWPQALEPHLRDVPVAIARTEPAWDGREEVREIERLFVESVLAAQDCIYIENQYLTSWAVGEALEASLSRPQGPEVVIVTPRHCSGWLEQASMGVLRTRLLRRLREADHAGRMRVYAVRSGEDVWLNVHAKVMAIDDRLFRAGSANLSNRSMGLDTECDLIVEAEADAERSRRILFLRDDLVAEHLGVEVAAVERARAETGSLGAAIERLRGRGERTLEPLPDEPNAELEAMVPDTALLDPERPVSADRLLSEMLPDDPIELVRHPVLRVLAVAGLALGAAALWRYTSLGEWLEPERLAQLGAPLRAGWMGPVAGVLAFTVAGFLMVPLIALIVAAALLYGPALGFGVSLAGALASALASWGVGRLLWRDAVRRIGGRRLNRLSRRLAERGVLAMAGIRMLPIAPYTVVNLVAGASHIRLRDFALGTLLGIAPGAAALTLFSSQAAAAARDPDAGSLLLLAGAGLLLIAALWGARRLLERRGET